MGNIPVQYIGYGAAGAMAVCFIIFIWSFILCILKAKKTEFEGKKNTVIVSLGCIVVALASWGFNLGWLRFVMTLLSVPFIYCSIFFIVNIVAGKYKGNCAILKWCNILYCATFVVANVLYPDVAGTVSGVGDTYFLFGLVKNHPCIPTVQTVAEVVLVIHALLFVAQLVLVGMAKNTDEVPAVEEKEEVAEVVEETSEVSEEKEEVEESEIKE